MQKFLMILMMFFSSCSSFEDIAKKNAKSFLMHAKDNDIKNLRKLSLLKDNFDRDSTRFLIEIEKIHQLIKVNHFPNKFDYLKYNSNWRTAMVSCELGKIPGDIFNYTLRLDFVDKDGKTVLLNYYLDTQVEENTLVPNLVLPR